VAERLPPALEAVLDYMEARPCIYVSASEVARALGITYDAARYRLMRLAELGYIDTYITYIVRPRIRRRWFHIHLPYIGTEGKTGYDIYYSPRKKAYIITNPTTREKVREEHKIVVEYTASIETGLLGKTGSFERLVVEITAITGVKEATIEDLERIDGEMESGVLDYLANPWAEGGNWGAALAGFRKKGTQYNGLSIVEEQKHYGYRVPQYPRVAIHVEKVAWFKVEKTPPDRPELKPGDMVKVTKAEDLSWALRMVRLGYLKETDLTGARVHDYGWHEFSLR
jgi:DNA-binding Lrp family transcriptional regulator